MNSTAEVMKQKQVQGSRQRLPVIRSLREKFRLFWPLTKDLQTGLLLSTGLAGFLSARCPIFNLGTLAELTFSLFLAIGGSTVLNMWYDRDIDARMDRTHKRPLPSGRVDPQQVLILGLSMSALGIAWAFLIQPLYGAVVLAGMFFDVVVYTIWLKRRTSWSIIWGGISGGMPILAGRVLGTGEIDWIGVLLALAVLFWIPTHIMTFNLRYNEDYCRAGIPTFPQACGFQTARLTIAVASLLSAASIGIAAYGIGLTWGYLRLLGVLSLGLLTLSIVSLARPSQKVNFGLFKYASFYMFSTMLLIVAHTI